jgi:hypothetical protein
MSANPVATDSPKTTDSATLNADASETTAGAVIPAHAETPADLAVPKSFPDVSEKPLSGQSSSGK